jgi:hypothetical protein
MSVVTMRMIVGTVGGVVRTPGGKQCTGKEKQLQLSFSQGETKRSAHN